MIELKCKFYNLDVPNRNGYVYTEEAVNGLYDKHLHSDIPVYIRDGSGNDGDIVGKANLLDVNYPEVDFYITTGNKVLESLIDAKVGGFIMRGLAQVDPIINDKLIYNYQLQELNFSMYPSQSSSVEIIKE